MFLRVYMYGYTFSYVLHVFIGTLQGFHRFYACCFTGSVCSTRNIYIDRHIFLSIPIKNLRHFCIFQFCSGHRCESF